MIKKQNREMIIFSERNIQTEFAKNFSLMQKFEFVVPNCKLAYDSECDLAAFTKSGFVHEFEIKISVADYKNESNKTVLVEGHFMKSKRQFVKENKIEMLQNGFCVPNYFSYLVPDNLISVNEIPQFAGLYYVNEYGRIYCVRSPKRLHKRKLDIEERYKQLRKLGYRYWSQRTKIKEGA